MSAAIDDVLALVRPDLQAFAGYSSARSAAVQGEVWLNANESAWANPADAAGSSRRYPEPQPLALREGLAALYGVTPQQLLIGRGSDEAIDLLVRALCVPGRDGVLVTPPVFGMYAVCARLQGAIRQALSPRFVPDEIVQVAEIPRTLSGKKQELPIKKLMLGQPLDKVVNKEAMANPGCLDWYVGFAAQHAKAQAA